MSVDPVGHILWYGRRPIQVAGWPLIKEDLKDLCVHVPPCTTDYRSRE